ncbi:single-stranded DNA-binding protein, partial [Rhodoblastus acidophilus]
MSQCAEFHIIGRVGQLKKVGTTLRVTIAASYPYKDERGDWQDRTRWNEITIFYDAR